MGKTRAVFVVTLGLALTSCSDGTSGDAVADDERTGATAATSTAPATNPPPSTTPVTSEQTTEPPATTPPETAPPDTAPPTTEPPPPEPDSEYPAQPDGVPWPTESWPVGDPPEGFDAATVDAAVEAAFGADDNEARLRSIVAVHRGAIVYERYHPLETPDTVFSSFSVAKSVTSALIGLLVDGGLLDVDAPAPVEEWQEPGDPRAAITLEHLLHMSSGLDWEEVYSAEGTAGQMFASPDWADFVVNQPLEAEPGAQFEYSTGTTAALAEILADQLGGPEALTAFIETELLDPLGIESTNLITDSTGQFAGGLSFDSTARDFARFGYLFLRGGEWDGEQILSSDWIDYSATPSPTNPEYGAQWWLYGPPDTLLASGLFGQQILVAPELDLVIVVTSTNGGDSWAPMIATYDQFDALS
jgi:CubicO group peptidase (beta-lactamase class C family)